MQPLNPFLAAFFKSPLAAQCTPVHHHVLLVPATDVLLTCREIETGGSLHDIVASEDFLASHVLRIPVSNAPPGSKDAAQNLREARGKAKPFSTINGRSLVIKDNFVYTNKGFKSLAQAQLLNDVVWYPDVLEPRQWLIYFISRPLVGTWEEDKIVPAVLVEGLAKKLAAERSPSASEASHNSTGPRKKDVKNFHELLNNFPIIARQMQSGLEKLFQEFTKAFERPLPPPPSANSIPDPEPDGPIIAAMKRARADSGMSTASNGNGGGGSLPVTEDFYAEDDEDVMRASLESAVTAAIDLFQGVDKQQLSLLGTTTELTGATVERMIERYVAEHVHQYIFPRLSGLKRAYDLELEAKIRQMEHIDVSQLGIFIQGGTKGKHGLTIQLGLAVEEFRKTSAALCPQEMTELLLSTMKAVSRLTTSKAGDGAAPKASSASEKSVLTVNADTLVSLLLFVVIRAQVRHLQARLTYIRQFVFVDDVDSGEMGYALSTFEAVLAYLSLDSAGLRRASRRNKALWDAAAGGDMNGLRRIMELDEDAVDEDEEDFIATRSRRSSRSSRSWSLTNGTSNRSSGIFTTSESFSLGEDLSHVFPFHAKDDEDDSPPPPPLRRIKRVAMDTRSMSSSSEVSFHSRGTSIGTMGSALEGDISVERLSQTHDAFGQSIPMMAVQNGQAQVLRYLLSLSEYYPLKVILDDINNEDLTLLSAAIQLGNLELINMILDFVFSSASPEQISAYFALQDIWGRSIGHYLFHAPSLIERVGKLVPWRQKDKNGVTPLFALCRSYDHGDYHSMVDAAINAATEAQGDGLPLHLDDHVDGKGNTLLHIVNDPHLALRILRHCDVDVNATNEKRFTALMVASKYGRVEMVRSLFVDPRVDAAARELRGLTAVELAKDDDVRNRIDDLALFGMTPGPDARITGVVRAFFVEDASIRLVLKSAAPADAQSYTVTTSRRSLSDFEHLAANLALEEPASWIPGLASGLRSPFQVPSRPSRAVLRDIQGRADRFLKIMLTHPTFATHEMLWEFFLAPDLQLDAMEARSKLKAAARGEKVREEVEPIEDVREVEQFVDHARENVRSVNYSTKSVARRANSASLANSDLHEASLLLLRAASTLECLPKPHALALETYVHTLAPSNAGPHAVFHANFLALQSTIQAVLSSLSRPAALAAQIAAARKAAGAGPAGRVARWPLGLLDETRQRLGEEREERARGARREADGLARELRYTQQVVAGELAGWQEMHDRMGRRAIRVFARGMVVQERARLEGMQRALRKLREGAAADSALGSAAEASGAGGRAAGKMPATGED